jgi:hypothetical protein
LEEAVEEFSKERAADAKALVTLSRASDRPGWIGFVTFVIPILMDAFFSKKLPGLFQPPVPALVHNEKYRFHQVGRRKRLDRIGQTMILIFAATGLVAATKLLVQSIARALGRSCWMVSLAMTVSVFGVMVSRKYKTPMIVQKTRS